MNLNLPISDQLANCNYLLIAGMGGGFDIFCGLPIYFELRRQDQNVHLANFSFSDIEILKGGIRLSETLVGVTADQKEVAFYFPEHYLARWFSEKRGEAVTIWCFEKTGGQPLLENYRILTKHLSVDGVLLIDGGVDSLNRGDESSVGTLIEDATSLFVVNELTQIHTRLMVCIAFGAERDIAYAHVLENIAAQVKAGGFLGSCSLTQQMHAYQAYEEAVLYVQNVNYQEPSVINSSILSAVRGHFGNYHLTEKTKRGRLWISPLMPIYWFFDLPVVAEHNLFLEELRETGTFMEAVQVFSSFRRSIPIRTTENIPL